MIVDEDSEVYFQLPSSKKIKKQKALRNRLEKHYEILGSMQESAAIQEAIISNLLDSRISFYSSNKMLLDWKYSVSVSQFNQTKSDSDTHDESLGVRQPIYEFEEIDEIDHFFHA